METSPLLKAFAPWGHIRAAINLGNPVLARKDGSVTAGVSVDMAHELGHRLGVDVQLLPFDTAAQSVEAVGAGDADIGFFAIDPARSNGIAFTAPYVLIEGAYLVRNESPLQSNDEVDQEGRLVVVGKGSAYDLYLTRNIKHAHIVRAPSSNAVVQTFITQNADVAAGVKQQLEADASQHAGLRLLPGPFMVIRQAMGIPTDRGSAAAVHLREFVEDVKSSGFVAKALERNNVRGASVAPSEPV